MRPLLAATQFLTRLPLGRFSAQARDRARAPYWYGVVGLAIGALLAAIEYQTRRWLPLPPRLALVLVLNAVLTGGLHLDGLADTADGLGGAAGRERALAVLRDSRSGVYGVLALLAVLGLQAVALGQLPPSALSRALLLAPAWGRGAVVFAAALGRPARDSGLGHDFIAASSGRHALAALAPAAAMALWFRAPAALAAGLTAVAAAAFLVRWAHRRLGGQTGDTLGCVNEVAETLTYWSFMVIR